MNNAINNAAAFVARLYSLAPMLPFTNALLGI